MSTKAEETQDTEAPPYKRSFLSKLLVMLAPQDELMRYAAMQAPKDERKGVEYDRDGKPTFILIRSARHLGSV
ncbi:hypothetical protein [Kordiimonas sp.]|uniref:hypothetical protein n=1 Tax=Kordiimonas sp. TaxID=1970157 RepID=UPI003A93233C